MCRTYDLRPEHITEHAQRIRGIIKQDPKWMGLDAAIAKAEENSDWGNADGAWDARLEREQEIIAAELAGLPDEIQNLVVATMAEQSHE